MRPPTITTIAAAAVCGGIGALLLEKGAKMIGQQVRRTRQIKSEHKEMEERLKSINSNVDYDPELIDEQLSRNRAFLGEEGLEKVRNAFVIVVGAGGVGSWVVTMLTRSGCGRIRVIDFDQVTLSSLNRHAIATLADVGTPKVKCLERRLKQVAPWVPIEPIVEVWQLEQAARLLDGSPTFVVDAIDNIDTKVDLLWYCYTNKIPVLSSMGASCKSDPTRISIGDISITTEDPLSRAVRRRLRLRGIITGITTVFSTEKPSPEKAKLLPIPDDAYELGNVEELAVLQDFRVRILPVLGTMPGIFGLALATHLISLVADYPITDYIEGRNRVKTYDSIMNTLTSQSKRLYNQHRIPLDLNDVGYLVEEVFRGRSVVSRESTRLALTIWLPRSNPLSLDNIVLMTKQEASKHEKLCLVEGKDPIEVWGPKVVALVNKRLQEERFYSRFRE